MNYEEYLYQKYKDNVIRRKSFIEMCSKFRGVNGEELYKRIVDYQIKKYHCQLMYMDYGDYVQFKNGWNNRHKRRNGVRRMYADD